MDHRFPDLTSVTQHTLLYLAERNSGAMAASAAKDVQMHAACDRRSPPLDPAMWLGSNIVSSTSTKQKRQAEPDRTPLGKRRQQKDPASQTNGYNLGLGTQINRHKVEIGDRCLNNLRRAQYLREPAKERNANSKTNAEHKMKSVFGHKKSMLPNIMEGATECKIVWARPAARACHQSS